MSEKNSKINRRMIKKYRNKLYRAIVKDMENYNFIKRLKYLITGKI